MTGEPATPGVRTYLTAELKCYLCGASSGTIEREQGVEHVVLLRRPGSEAAETMRDWRGIRCSRCGGPTFLDEPDVVTRYDEGINWLEERPRRGRPPKRVVEERRRQQDAPGPHPS